MAASVHQRLLQASRSQGRPFSDLLQLYALERWLFRLSQSPHRERFFLKGALLLVAWELPSFRPTRDIDLLGQLSNELDSIRSVIAEVVQTPVEDDGLMFDPASIATERIAEDADYAGVRARFLGRLGNSRIPMQVDIGFSDVITPRAVAITYPTILDQPSPELLAYTRETVIAEKFEAMVSLGELNSRMKDFFDIWLLAQTFQFDGETLAAAMHATFTRRRTTIEADPICFSHRFALNDIKAKQWSAFVRRARLVDAPAFADIINRIEAFLSPPVRSTAAGERFSGQWTPGGPWQLS
jgi:hypothetical protein